MLWFKKSVASDIFEVHTLYNIAISCTIKSTDDWDRNVIRKEGKIKTLTTHTYTRKQRCKKKWGEENSGRARGRFDLLRGLLSSRANYQATHHRYSLTSYAEKYIHTCIHAYAGICTRLRSRRMFIRSTPMRYEFSFELSAARVLIVFLIKSLSRDQWTESKKKEKRREREKLEREREPLGGTRSRSAVDLDRVHWFFSGVIVKNCSPGPPKLPTRPTPLTFTVHPWRTSTSRVCGLCLFFFFCVLLPEQREKSWSNDDEREKRKLGTEIHIPSPRLHFAEE